MLYDSTTISSYTTTSTTPYTFTIKDATDWVQVNNTDSDCTSGYTLPGFNEGVVQGKQQMKERYKTWKRNYRKKVDKLEAELQKKQEELDLLISKQQFRFKGFSLRR